MAAKKKKAPAAKKEFYREMYTKKPKSRKEMCADRRGGCQQHGKYAMRGRNVPGWKYGTNKDGVEDKMFYKCSDYKKRGPRASRAIARHTSYDKDKNQRACGKRLRAAHADYDAYMSKEKTSYAAARKKQVNKVAARGSRIMATSRKLNYSTTQL